MPGSSLRTRRGASKSRSAVHRRRQANGENPNRTPRPVGSRGVGPAPSFGERHGVSEPQRGGTRCPAKPAPTATALSLTKTALPSVVTVTTRRTSIAIPCRLAALPATLRRSPDGGFGSRRCSTELEKPIHGQARTRRRASLSSTTLCNCRRVEADRTEHPHPHRQAPRRERADVAAELVPPLSSVRSASGTRPRGAEGARVAVARMPVRRATCATRRRCVIGADVPGTGSVDERVLVGCARAPAADGPAHCPEPSLESARATPAFRRLASARRRVVGIDDQCGEQLRRGFEVPVHRGRHHAELAATAATRVRGPTSRAATRRSLISAVSSARPRRAPRAGPSRPGPATSGLGCFDLCAGRP